MRVRDVTITGTTGPDITLSACHDVELDRLHLEYSGAELVLVTDCTRVFVRDGFMVIGDKNTLAGVRFVRVTDGRIERNPIDPGDALLVDLVDSSGVAIVQNVLDGGDSGVVLEGESHGNVVLQNVSMNMTYDGVYVGESATGNTVAHNTLSLCASPLAIGAPDAVLVNDRVSDDAATFVAPATYDFRLVVGAAAIDAGEDAGYDLLPGAAGQFLGRAPDLGAVESF